MTDIFSTRRIPDSCFGSIIEFNQPNLPTKCTVLKCQDPFLEESMGIL